MGGQSLAGVRGLGDTPTQYEAPRSKPERVAIANRLGVSAKDLQATSFQDLIPLYTDELENPHGIRASLAKLHWCAWRKFQIAIDRFGAIRFVRGNHSDPTGRGLVCIALDCKQHQQSDGPWFDSGWPDISNRCGVANSATGAQARVARSRAEYPHQPGSSGDVGGFPRFVFARFAAKPGMHPPRGPNPRAQG